MIDNSYEYLLSSLPYLSFSDEEAAKSRVYGLLDRYAGSAQAALSPVAVLDAEARKFLPAAAFTLFRKLDLRQVHGPEFRQAPIPLLADFAHFNFELKRGLRAWRLAKQGSAPAPVRPAVVDFIGRGTPLEREIRLLEYQWNHLQDLATGYFAGQDAVFAYKLKLLLLLRRWSFDPQRGFARFTELTTTP